MGSRYMPLQIIKVATKFKSVQGQKATWDTEQILRIFRGIGTGGVM